MKATVLKNARYHEQKMKSENGTRATHSRTFSWDIKKYDPIPPTMKPNQNRIHMNIKNEVEKLSSPLHKNVCLMRDII